MSTKTLLYLLAAVVVFAAGFWLRMAHLGDPMRNDEAFTDLVYVKRGEYFDYSRPNNHVLNTLLMAAVADAAGDSPAWLRMPAFVFGLLLIPAAGWFCFQLCGSGEAAVAAMALAASSTTLVEYSVNARGYTLVALAAVGMASLSVRLRECPKWRAGWMLWVVCGIAGLCAVPVMIFAIAAVAALLVADRWERARRILAPLAASLAAIAVGTGMFYTPVIAKSGVAAIVSNPFVAAMSMGSIPGELAARCRETVAIWNGTGSGLFVPFLCVGTVLALLVVRRGNRFVLLALVGVLVALAAAVAQRRVAPVRAYIYLQVWMIPCACAWLALVARKEMVRTAAAALILVMAAQNWFAVKRQPLLISEDPRTYVEAREVAAELIQHGAYRGDTSVIWRSDENIWPPLLYYILRMHPDAGHTVPWNGAGTRQVFILLNRPDKLADFLSSKPAFSQIYAEPKLVALTPNSQVYLARRR